MRPKLRSTFSRASLISAVVLSLLAAVLVPAASAVPVVASLAPTGLMLDAEELDETATPNTATITATWTAPVDAPAGTSYDVTFTQVEDSTVTSTFNVTNTSKNLTFAEAGKSYLVTVTTNATGATATDKVEATIALKKFNAPALRVSMGDAKVSATWTLDDTPTYPAVAEYKLEYKIATDTTWSTFVPEVADALAKSASVTGLTNGSKYEFRVSAKNLFGWSELSATQTATPSAGKNDQEITPTTPLTPVELPKEIGSWCKALDPPQKDSIVKRKAQQLMAGTIDFGKGGRYWIGGHPNWKPQSTADTSGNRHVHSLRWALPLLYRGVEKQKPALVDRFRELILYWIEDHQSAASRTTWIRGSIYGGTRTKTLVCAAQTLNDPRIRTAALRDADQMRTSYWGGQNVAYGTNNTDLIRQTGAFAAYCWTGSIEHRDTSWANLVAVARNIVYPDGSDVEGSPAYGEFIEKLLNSVEETAKVCGTSADPIPGIRTTVYDFIAHAVRPDFTVESLGDSVTDPVKATLGLDDTRAEWLRTGGASGTTPSSTYATYDGGYIFGRGAWLARGAAGNDSYYSLRYSGSRSSTAHTHDDGAGFTYFSHGVSWIGDPGPYRYDNSSSLRAYVRSRAAHSSIVVGNVARTKSGGVRKVAGTTDGNVDTSCVKDNTWSTVSVTRCVRFVRSIDATVIVDYVDATAIAKGKKAKKSKRIVTQSWQLPPGIAPQRTETGLLLNSAGMQLDVVANRTSRWKLKGATSSSSVGWFTGEWGVKEPGAVASRKLKMSGLGGSAPMITVLLAHSPDETVSATIGDSSVTITRNGTTLEVGLPTP